MINPERDLLDDWRGSGAAERLNYLRHVGNGLGDRQGAILVLVIELRVGEPHVQPQGKPRDHHQDRELSQHNPGRKPPSPSLPAAAGSWPGAWMARVLPLLCPKDP